MNSRNGISKEFRFTIVNPDTGESTILNFSFKHQALREKSREKWITHRFDDGSKEQKFLYLHTHFEIDWSELIVGSDADKLQTLRNAEYNGYKLLLTPHTDIPGRYFDVITSKSDSGDSEEIDFSQIINHRNSPGNEGTIMYFETRNPQYSWSITDPSIQQGLSAMGMEEYIGL